MTESDRSIIAKLTTELEMRIPLTYGAGYKLSPAPPIRYDRRYSFVFRYWLVAPDGAIQPLFVKIPHPSSMRTMDEAIRSDRLRAEVKHEFEVMQAIASVISSSGHSKLCSINPGFYSSDFNALIMEEFQLAMMKGYLQKWEILIGKKQEWTHFEELLRRAAQWLKIIHDSFRKGRHASLLDLRVAELLTFELESLERILGYELTTIRDLFFHVYDLNELTQVPVSSLHHDFHLGNIFVTHDGRVGALDPNWKKSGTVYEDLASLLIDPMTRKFQVISLGLYFRPLLKKRFEGAVLAGYFGRENAPPLLFFYCALAALTKWRMNEELLRSTRSKVLAVGGWAVSKYTRPYFSRLVMNYLNRELRLINEAVDSH